MADDARRTEASISSRRSRARGRRWVPSAPSCWRSAPRSACIPTCSARASRASSTRSTGGSWRPASWCLRGHVLVVERRHRRVAQVPHRRGPARPALRHDPVHRLGGAVLRRLLLGVLRFLALSRLARDAGAHRGRRRHVAAQGRACHRAVRPAVHEHADPAALGHHGDLGAPCDPRGQQARRGARPAC